MQENHQINDILKFKWMPQKNEEIQQIIGILSFKGVLQKKAKKSAR